MSQADGFTSVKEHAYEGFIKDGFVFGKLVPDDRVYKNADGVFEMFLLVHKLLLICILGSQTVGERNLRYEVDLAGHGGFDSDF